MQIARNDTVTLYILKLSTLSELRKPGDVQGYSCIVLPKVLRRASFGARSGEPDHGMVVYAFDMDHGDLSALSDPCVLEGYCLDGVGQETDRPWEIGAYKIASVKRFDTGSSWMRHWRILCK